MSTTEILTEVKALTKRWFALSPKEPFIPGKSKIGLAVPSYDWEEAYEAIESILTTQVTMGEKVKQFEEAFAKYVGVPYAVMVNSGSSANLLALSILSNPLTKNGIKRGDEVITPAVTWVTTVYPIIQVGAVPVLVDVDLDTFNISVREIEKAVTPKTKAIMLVHLCGNPCQMEIMDIARKHNLLVIEDSCESHGAEVDGQKVGSFGDLSTFSFFFTHHISTIEGGMVLTRSEEYAELAKAMRAFGWIRDLKDRERIAARYSHIDPKILFITTGYNLRPTDIQGAFGIHQIKKLDRFIDMRRENARYWTESLRQFPYLLLHEERPGTKHVWHHYPVTVKPDAPFTRKELVDFLQKKGLETRPIMTGNMAEQPVMRLFEHRTVGDLPNSRIIQRHSFLFGIHQGIGKQEREAVVDYFREFMYKVRL
ncbi:MAG: DegT/DnrJ/EryC1/StrS family aminotransferase [Dehalococcoidales bacterium]|nr:DegT/DnrJ/EryC1/StrS family aminotransferase [Dehalococcoidales bacterium]